MPCVVETSVRILCSGLVPIQTRHNKLYRRGPKIATRIIPVLKGKSFEERLEALALTTLIERRYRGDMIQTHKMLTREEDIDPTKFFQMAIERSDPALARGFKIFKILANRKQRRYPFPWGFAEEIFLFHEGLQTPGTS
ncbi:unnamed protein product [Meganyctiphanes norvegica]|uniref:Uncharacterized protein n=1 Tax=Meganyctiphanes norvegica TaxID=48144 RepID=A0AAV2QNK7_MEGNR